MNTTEGRKVRGVLMSRWLDDEVRDLNLNRDPVGKLIRLRRSRPDDHNVYPCINCGDEGLPVIKYLILYFIFSTRRVFYLWL